MTPSDEIIRTTHLLQFGGAYFHLKNQYKILLNMVKKNFFRVYDANKNKKIETILLYFVKRAQTWDHILKSKIYKNCMTQCWE